MDSITNNKKTVLVNFLRLVEEDMNAIRAEGDFKQDLLHNAKSNLDTAYEITEDDYKNTPVIDLVEHVSRIEQEKNKDALLNKARKYNKLGNEAFRNKLYQIALNNYTIAIECNPLPTYFCNRAEAYHCLKEYDNAMEDCNHALNIRPVYARAHNKMGLIHLSQKHYKQAVKCFKDGNFYDTLNLVYLKNAEIAQQELAKTEEQQFSLFSTYKTKSSTSFENPSNKLETSSDDSISLRRQNEDNDLFKIHTLNQKSLFQTNPISLTESDDNHDVNPSGP